MRDGIVILLLSLSIFLLSGVFVTLALPLVESLHGDNVEHIPVTAAPSQLWTLPTDTPLSIEPISTATSVSPMLIQQAPVNSPTCHPSYAVCLPVVDDLDCGEIPAQGFAVSGFDEYKLDGDQNGLACEG